MPPRFQLPAPAAAPTGSFWTRLRHFVRQTWRGRLLLASLAIQFLRGVGLPVPGPIRGVATLVLWVFTIWACYRVAGFVLRRFFWRIRTKLLISYLFIAVVPVVLLTLLFMLSAVLLASLMAAGMVTAEVDRLGQELERSAESALIGLPHEDAAAAEALKARLEATKTLHPEIAYTLLRRQRVIAAVGEAPRVMPSWWKGPGFGGLVVALPGTDRLRAVWTSRDDVLILDAPVDRRLFSELESRAGIQVMSEGGHVEAGNGGIQIDLDDSKPRLLDPKQSELSGIPFFALSDRTDWDSGRQDNAPFTFQFEPIPFVRRLSPGRLNTADVLVKALTALGVVFLVMYSVALLIGLALARSVTRSVHALSVGTERLRRGDFEHPIPIYGRDQLGELAESFNMMSSGIQDLLREQAEKERLEEELRIARQIQMSLLPQGEVSLPGLRIAALCLPAAEVGGDYYDLLPLSETRMGVLVADVSGKGTSAALYMAELKGLVLSLSRIYESPAKLLVEANRILAATMDPRSFITMTYAVVDTAARTMTYARAGHNPMIQLQAGKGTRVLAPAGLGLGIDRGTRFEEILEEDQVPLASGDVFVFFTDGLSEAMNGKAELFGERRLRDLVEDGHALESEELKDRILAEIHAFVGGEAQHDDMTMVILKVM